MIRSTGAGIKRVLRVLYMLAGLGLALYGVVILFSLDQLIIGKFSSGGRDTSTAILLTVIGAAIFLYGLWADDGK